MNPNNVNHFSSAAVGLNRKRSTFTIPFCHKTTLNAGKLIPLAAVEMLPCDNVSIPWNSVLRGMTPLYPVMDNAYFDMYAFFVPNRLIWDHWKEFLGENNTDYWQQKTEYFVPQIYSVGGTSPDPYIGSVWDYLGVPPDYFSESHSVSDNDVTLSALYPRAYVKVFNDWFRDENLQTPAHLYTDDTNRPIRNTDDYVSTAELGFALCPVNKFHDYFTSALPAPQKHAPITLSLISGDYAPVVGAPEQLVTPAPGVGAIQFADSTGSKSLQGEAVVSNGQLGYVSGAQPTITSLLTPVNLGLPSDSLQAVSVNELRLAFQTQKFYETQARGGTRYTELLYSMFGVRSSDGRLQRAEFLGGKRFPINMSQVAQSAPNNSDDSSVLGDTGAFSLTGSKAHIPSRFIEEHGILIVVGCVRTDHTYQQGINRQYTKKSLFDYYFPVFANIGEQPVYNYEIYANSGTNAKKPFGYQEAWAEYRYKPSVCSGYMRSGVTGSLDSWHYGDNFASMPVLGDQFIRETPDNIDRTLAVPSESSHQFLLDMYIPFKISRCMPMYSVPGLIDHG